METTTVNIPTRLLPLWKSLEGLNEQDTKAIMFIVSDYMSKKKEKKVKIPISPLFKMVEIGEDRSIGLSADYKKEIGERKLKRAE